MDQDTTTSAPANESEWDDDMFGDDEVPEPMCDLANPEICETCQ